MQIEISCARMGAGNRVFWTITHVDMIDMKYKNLIGHQVRRLRTMMNLSQSQLAVKLEVSGLDIDRSRLSKIECRLVYVSDYEQLFLADVLKVSVEELYPRSIFKLRLRDSIPDMMKRDPRTFTPRKR